MSETETRDAAYTANVERHLYETMRERDAARTEVARLRGVVDVVRALADGVDHWTPYATRDIGEAFLAVSVHDLIADIHAALPSVPSSGETGEIWANAYADPDQAHDSISPASPEPTGADEAQAGGDGEDPRALAALLHEHAEALRVLLRKPAVARSLHRLADRVDSLAARPVLSREALYARIEEHLRDASLMDDPCWQRKPEWTTWGSWARLRADHLAAVLDTQEAGRATCERCGRHPGSVRPGPESGVYLCQSCFKREEEAVSDAHS